jgi:hypothetical protein
MPDRLRHSLFHAVNNVPCPLGKVKCFSKGGGGFLFLAQNHGTLMMEK